MIQTNLPGVLLLEPKLYRDARGYFCETYHHPRFAAAGINDTFVQDNQSQSLRHTLRGLHYQLRHAQAKLCRVVRGEVLDVAVDIRVGSPSFGRSVTAILSEENKQQIYIPPGFAHGFVVLSETADFLYKCSDFYFPEDERGILWNDPDLAIPWGIADPLISEKDKAHLPLRQVPQEFLPRYGGN